MCVCVWEDENLRIGSKVISPMLEEHNSKGTDSEPLGKTSVERGGTDQRRKDSNTSSVIVIKEQV